MLRAALALTLAGSAIFVVSAAAPSAAGTDPAHAAAQWLVAQQRPDGAIPTAGERSDQLAEAAASIAAAGQREAASKALTKIAAMGFGDTTRGGQAGRLVTGIVETGGDPRTLGGRDFVAHLRSFYDPTTGRYDSNLYADALALVGLKAAAETIPAEALRFIELNQCRDGGFGHEAGCLQGADVDTTAMALAALVAGGRLPTEPSVGRARAWLVGARNDQDGFGDVAGAATNSNSTGLALSAIATLGESASSPTWAKGGRTPVTALAEIQTASGGFPYRAGGKVDGYATVQAIPGLLARPIPFPATSGRGASATGATGSGAAHVAAPGSHPSPAVPGSTLSPSTTDTTELHRTAGTDERPTVALGMSGTRHQHRSEPAPWPALLAATLGVLGTGAAAIPAAKRRLAARRR